jgi:putative oxidoreductase
VKILDRLQPLALLLMRVALGAIMIAHGAQKLFGGMSSFERVLSGAGVPWYMAYVVTAIEFGGGLLVLTGLLTRLSALLIFGEMCGAIAKVHWKNGLKGPAGYEFPLACAALAFALIFLGAGPISLDWAIWGGGGKSNK